MDRPLAIAFGISLVFHASFLGLQLVQLREDTRAKKRQILDIIYEYELAKEEVRQLQRQVTKHGRPPMNPPGTSSTMPGSSTPMPQIRIPDRPMVTLSPTTDTRVSRSTVIDLTNLVAAAQGDPVLLSYFSAIREQIQKTANRRTWMTGEATEGIVYVSFVLDASGAVHSATVLPERSVPSRVLQEIALRIIKASGPFPAFPPSIQAPSKTVVVPLEFLLSS